jgi:hypothetical protein
VHAPAAVDELEPALVDQLARIVALAVVGVLPPSREEANLDIPSCRVRVRVRLTLHDF